MPIIDMTQIEHELQSSLNRAMDQNGKEIVNRIIAEAQRRVYVELTAFAATYALNVVQMLKPETAGREYRVILEVRGPGEQP
jgi:chemotaxis regulatin CheY-phosphate phosphatase CheZ